MGAIGNQGLERVLSCSKDQELKREIEFFQRKDGNLFFEAWKDFKHKLLKCPTHNMPKDDQVQAFYEGLNDTNKAIVDSACNGILMEKNGEEAIEMFEELSENSQQFSMRGRSTKRRQGVYEVNTNDGVQAEMVAMNTKRW
ncbi:hypothetical protein ACFX1T_022735 [Malus domestica]